MIPRTFIHDCIIIGLTALVVLYIQDAFGQTKEERKAAAREVATKHEACAYQCFAGCRK